MTPRYNKFLDLVALAAAAFDQKDTAKASKLMTAAFKHPHRASAVEAMLDHNQQAVEASSFDGDLDEDFPGEELRIEVDENKDREVQQGAARRRMAARRVSASAAAKKQNYFDALSR